jgi:uncharacterized protein (UPF0332 family)
MLLRGGSAVAPRGAVVLQARAEVIAQYGRRFVREGRMDRRFHKLLDGAFSIRQIADYAIEFDMDSEELREMIEEGRSFLCAAEERTLRGLPAGP